MSILVLISIIIIIITIIILILFTERPRTLTRILLTRYGLVSQRAGFAKAAVVRACIKAPTHTAFRTTHVPWTMDTLHALQAWLLTQMRHSCEYIRASSSCGE
jgi:hypothetical protein